MKRIYVNELLLALRNVELAAIEDNAEQFAVIDNIIALSEDSEILEKAQREAVAKFKPENFDSLQGEDKEKALATINKQLSDFFTPRLEEDVKLKLKKLSTKSIEKIFNQKQTITTAQKAVIVRFLK